MTSRKVLGFIIGATVVATAAAYAQSPGQRPLVPLSHSQWLKLKDDPEALARLGANLPPVSSTMPNYGPPVQAPAGAAPSPFSPPGENAPVGAWSNLAHAAPTNLSNPRLLSDGTVIAHNPGGSNWYKLTPDNTGSYVNGTWTSIAALPTINTTLYQPNFFASGLLPDGRFIINGGEYDCGIGSTCQNNQGSWTTKGAIYDPAANTWTSVTPPSGWSTIGDATGVVLPNGTWLVTSCCDQIAGAYAMALWNPTTLAWTATGTNKASRNDEESWAQLSDDRFLVVKAYTGGGCILNNNGSEAYTPSLGTWADTGNAGAQIADCNTTNAAGGSPTYETGPNQMMYNGKMIAFGGTTANVAHTRLYTVATNTWSAGPDFPSTCDTGSTPCTMADAASVVMPNGKVLIAASHGAFNTPAKFFEYDPTANTFTATTGTADAASISAFYVNFMMLPTGQVIIFETYSSNVQIYTPDSTYQAAWQPVITSVPNCVVASGTYALSGHQLNGLSEGGMYGDDVQMSTNYPIVKIVNNSTGHVFFAKTFNHSSRSIIPNAFVTTNFTVKAGTETGASTLYSIANGIPSAGQAITVGATCPTIANHDFDASKTSDVLWRNTSTGDAALWLMNGTTYTGTGLGNVSTIWSVTGQRDFDGNGKSDVLWRDTSGNLAIWFMNGGSYTGAGLGNVATVWGVVGTGDFNNDAKGDILWRDSSGNLAMWQMNGSSYTGIGMGNVATVWAVAGTGDVNGDSKADIIWRNTSTGDVAIWLMNGAALSSGVGLGNVPTNWSIVGTGDFNGDGKADIIWRDTSGNVAIWLMNGTTYTGAGLGNVATAWIVAGTGDYDGDGHADILWRNTSTGAAAVWFMNGSTLVNGAGLGTVTTPWVIQSANAD